MSQNTQSTLEVVYREYIATILAKDVAKLSLYVSDEVIHNGKKLGLEGYKDLILRNIIQTGVNIEIKRLVADEKTVAAVLIFTTQAACKELVGIQLDGTSFSYAENVVYDFKDGRIIEVFSIFEIDVIRSHARV